MEGPPGEEPIETDDKTRNAHAVLIAALLGASALDSNALPQTSHAQRARAHSGSNTRAATRVIGRNDSSSLEDSSDVDDEDRVDASWWLQPGASHREARTRTHAREHGQGRSSDAPLAQIDDADARFDGSSETGDGEDDGDDSGEPSASQDESAHRRPAPVQLVAASMLLLVSGSPGPAEHRPRAASHVSASSRVSRASHVSRASNKRRRMEEGGTPVGVRPRVDSEYSIDALVEAARDVASAEAMSGDEEEWDDDDDEDEDDEQSNPRPRSRGRSDSLGSPTHSPSPAVHAPGHAHSIVRAQDAHVSAAAAAFLQRRRSAWAERLPVNGADAPVPSLSESGLACALPPDQLALYNTDGRIGIYFPEERQYIIERYMVKRDRRVWGKKIRYNCRKNLADRRVRVKGRFVKAEMAASIASKEISVAGSYIPNSRHEQRTERLLRERSLSESVASGSQRSGAAARTQSPRVVDDRPPSAASSRGRKMSMDVDESPYKVAYTTSAASRSARRERSVSAGMAADFRADVPTAVQKLALLESNAAASGAIMPAIKSSGGTPAAGKRSRTVSFHDSAALAVPAGARLEVRE